MEALDTHQFTRSLLSEPNRRHLLYLFPGQPRVHKYPRTKTRTDGGPLQRGGSQHFHRLRCNLRNRLNIPPIHGHRHDDREGEEGVEIVEAKEAGEGEEAVVEVVITAMTMVGAVEDMATRQLQPPLRQLQPQRLHYLRVRPSSIEYLCTLDVSKNLAVLILIYPS